MADSLQTLFTRCDRYADENGLLPLLRSGAIVAFSGGADSVFLLLLAERWQKKYDFPLAAVHVDHGIRKEEAWRDSEFCRELCAEKKIPLHVISVDIPAMSAKQKRGLEDCAREERYRVLEQIRTKLSASAVLVAHTASDQAETVLMHLLRGSGTRGLSGMAPVHEHILRPMLCISGDAIRLSLDEHGIAYVCDSTNQDISFRRNFIRREVFPLLKRNGQDPISAICRAADNIRADDAFLEEHSAALSLQALHGEVLSRSVLANAPDPLAIRVLTAFCKAKAPANTYPEQCHLLKALCLVRSASARFSLSLPGCGKMLCEGDDLRIEYGMILPNPSFCMTLSEGKNILPDGSILQIETTQTKKADCARNIYKLFIQAELSSATIADGWTVRSRRPGDRYRYGGMERDVAKQLSAQKVPLSLRRVLPVIEDEKGILWVPFLHARDAEKEEKHYDVTYWIRQNGKTEEET